MDLIGFADKSITKALKIYAIRVGWKNFVATPQFSKSYVEGIQKSLLMKILRHAIETVPYYKSLNSKSVFSEDPYKLLNEFPVITKEDIRTDIDKFISKGTKKITYKHEATSGSSGQPFQFLLDRKLAVLDDMSYLRFWSNVTEGRFVPGKPIVFLRSYSPRPGQPLSKFNKSNNILFLSAFHINESNIKFYVDAIEKSQSEIIHGYASSLYVLTEVLKKTNLTLPNIRAITCSSESLPSNMRDSIVNFWGEKIFDSYGLAEKNVLVQQCVKGSYHNNDDYGYLEINEKNQIIGTGFHNYSMPLIRYNTADIAIISGEMNESCTCGSSFTVPFKSILGRSDDILIAHDGTQVPTANFSTAFKKYSKLHQYKLIQNEDLSIEFQIVGTDLDSAYITNLINEISQRLGRLQVRPTFPEAIDRDPVTGKVKVTECRVKIVS